VADNAKSIAITGSPNTINNISIDILEGYIGSPLLGTLVSIEMTLSDHDSKPHQVLVIGQMAEPKSVNRWHEDPALKNYIKRRGTLPNLTGEGDITTADIMLLGAYERNDEGLYKKYRLSVPVGTGLQVLVARRDVVLSLMAPEQLLTYGWLARIFGSHDAPAPVYTKHFGATKSGGNGDAFMGAVFGPTGSGKTVIATTYDVLLARHENMGILWLDPQSEFSTNKIAKASNFEFDFHAMLMAATNGAFDPAKDIASIDEVQLEGPELFCSMLNRKKFFEYMGVGASLRNSAEDLLASSLRELGADWNPGYDIDHLEGASAEKYEQLKEAVVCACAGAYASEKKQVSEKTDRWDGKNKLRIRKAYAEIAHLFKPRTDAGKTKVELEQLIQGVMLNGRKFILDLDPKHLEMSDDFKMDLMHYVFTRISRFVHKQYKKLEADANCLIVMDEAKRFIPHSASEDSRLYAMSKYIAEKVTEFRKYNVGFQFITQNVTQIRSDIYSNLHYRIYGAGLTSGGDGNKIKELEGDDAFKTYATLPEPGQSGIYSYMVCGRILALGTTGKPMFIEGLGSDVDIMQDNDIAAKLTQYKAELGTRMNTSSKAAQGNGVVSGNGREEEPFEVGI